MTKNLESLKMKAVADNNLTLSNMTNFRLFQTERVSR